MSDPSASEHLVAHHYVDEAGTPTLFGRRRKTIVGQDGCSNYFILGALDVEAPEQLEQALADLRMKLLADPYLKRVPSMQPEKEKTAVFFHAKDDLPEVRYEVFRLLMGFPLRFRAVVRDKRHVVEEVELRNESDPAYRYTENEMYDSLVSHLFRWGFHEADHMLIRFAKRGQSDRTAALTAALEHARRAYQQSFGIQGHASVEIIPSRSRDSAGLQAVDYFLWALQRLYEQDDDRYWEFVREKASSVYDMDDRRKNPFGVYYRGDNPLTREARAKK